MTTDQIPFIDLDAQRRRLGARLEDAILKAVRDGRYIMGPQVAQLEERLSAFCGARHTVSCANGTDALGMVMMALSLRPGDAVICPAFTFAATAEAVAWLGATPVFADVSPTTFNLDPNSAEQTLLAARAAGLRVVGMIPVDLFGQPADYDALQALCDREGLWLMGDAAQSFGATWNGARIGRNGLATTTSFFPAKPLGCYGDGGAVFTDDDDLAAALRSIRVHGQGVEKYDNVRIGVNGRLDTVQAAVLLEKLSIFDEELALREACAARYDRLLPAALQRPVVDARAASAWAQYTVVLPDAVDRGRFQATLREHGIPTAVYYPRPLNQQSAYARYPAAPDGVPVSEDLARRVLSLPMHPYLDEGTQETIAARCSSALTGA